MVWLSFIAGILIGITILTPDWKIGLPTIILGVVFQTIEFSTEYEKKIRRDDDV